MNRTLLAASVAMSLAGLLAYGNANEIVKEMAAEVLPVVRHTPVLAGVNGTDHQPFCRAIDHHGLPDQASGFRRALVVDDDGDKGIGSGDLGLTTGKLGYLGDGLLVTNHHQ